MVKPVNGPKAPAGYTTIKLFDTKAKTSKSFFIPIGQKVTVNGKTYDPSKTKNNEFVFTGKKGEKNFEFLGVSLEAMDVNKDGRIDKKDTSYELVDTVNDNKRLPEGYGVTYLDPWTPDAFVDKGEGYVRIFKDFDKFQDAAYYVEINDGKEN